MRFALLTTAAALLAGASAQAGRSEAAATMIAGIGKLAGMAERTTELVRSVDRPTLGDTVPLVVSALNNIAGEMEAQADGLPSPDDTAAMTPFSDEEQPGVCNAFGHMAEVGDNLLSGLMKIRPLLEGTQFMEEVSFPITLFAAPFDALFRAFMQLASNCAQETIHAAPDVGSHLEETIIAYTGN